MLLPIHAGIDADRRQGLVRTHVVVHRQTDLLEVVRALCPPSRFTRGLNGRQQQANENGDDGNHHKQLDQGKTAVSSSHGLCPQENDGHPPSDRQRLLLRARITGALVRSRSATRTRPLYSRGDLVILFLSLGLGGARTGDCSLRLGRLLLDGRLVVFPATGQPQEAKAQQSKAQSTGEQPHDEYDSPQEWARLADGISRRVRLTALPRRSCGAVVHVT